MCEALIHSILMSDVKDTRKSCFDSTMENSEPKKTLKCHLELNFDNFQEKKNGKV